MASSIETVPFYKPIAIKNVCEPRGVLVGFSFLVPTFLYHPLPRHSTTVLSEHSGKSPLLGGFEHTKILKNISNLENYICIFIFHIIPLYYMNSRIF